MDNRRRPGLTTKPQLWARLKQLQPGVQGYRSLTAQAMRQRINDIEQGHVQPQPPPQRRRRGRPSKKAQIIEQIRRIYPPFQPTARATLVELTNLLGRIRGRTAERKARAMGPQVFRQAATKATTKREEAIEQRARAVGPQVFKQAATVLPRRSYEQEVQRLKQWLQNPHANSHISIKHISADDVLRLLQGKFPADFHILAKIDRHYIPLQYVGELLSELFDPYQADGYKSDWQMAYNRMPDNLELVMLKKARQQVNAAYFPFYHQLDKVDLSRYGIFRNDVEAGKYEANCLAFALQQAGHNIDRIKTMLTTIHVPRAQLGLIAEEMKIHIILNDVKPCGTVNITHYGCPTSLECRIGLRGQHYFLIDQTQYTSFAIKNYEAVKELPKWNQIVKFHKGGKAQRDSKRFITSLALVKVLLEKADDLLIPITLENCGENNGLVLHDYTNLSEPAGCENGLPINYNQIWGRFCASVGFLTKTRYLADTGWMSFDDWLIARKATKKEYLEYCVSVGCPTSINALMSIELQNRCADGSLLETYDEFVIRLNATFDDYTHYLVEHKATLEDYHKYFEANATPQIREQDRLRKEYRTMQEKDFRPFTVGAPTMTATNGAGTLSLRQVIFFDFETTTDGDEHKPYLICDSRGKTFRGPDCGLLWLRSLRGMISRFDKTQTQQLICIAHNLRYDISFLIKHINRAAKLIQTGAMVKSVSGRFYRFKDEYVDITFKDSYAMIPMPLSEFGKSFKLDVHKEIMPYDAYTEQSVTIPSIPLSQMVDNLENPNDSVDLIANCKRWDCMLEDGTVDHIGYSEVYCKFDVKTLEAGYMKFREWIMDITGIDVLDMVSLPQMSQNFGVKQGVFDGCYELTGIPRDFIQRCVIGGKVMTRDNQKFEVKEEIDDFDAVSLYPSAMVRMPGFLKGLPQVLTKEHMRQIEADPFLSLRQSGGYVPKARVSPSFDAFFVEIEVLSTGKSRHFPLLNKKVDGIRSFSNDHVGKGIYLDSIGLQDLVRFQELKFRVIRGYYYNQGFNTGLKSFMTMLFNERLAKKEQKNPVQIIYKLIMNAFYGRLIMKPIIDKQKFVYGEDEALKFLNYHFNNIKKMVKIREGMYVFKLRKSVIKHFNAPHLGTQVLSWSKRIMNEVMCLAEDADIPIYYQDTDSMHIRASGVNDLAKLYANTYGRELIGESLGQFHCDFEAPKGTTSKPVSVHSVFLGKKCYYDQIMATTNSGEKVYSDHIRMKAVAKKTIQMTATQQSKSVLGLYQYLLSGEPVEFDQLLAGRKYGFKRESDFSMTNRDIFILKLRF